MTWGGWDREGDHQWGCPPSPVFLMPRGEVHVYAALCPPHSDSFQGTQGPRASLLCTSLRCLLIFCVSSSNSAIPLSLRSMKNDDSVSPGTRVYASTHPSTYSLIQDLLTAGLNRSISPCPCLEELSLGGQTDKKNKLSYSAAGAADQRHFYRELALEVQRGPWLTLRASGKASWRRWLWNKVLRTSRRSPHRTSHIERL